MKRKYQKLKAEASMTDRAKVKPTKRQRDMQEAESIGYRNGLHRGQELAEEQLANKEKALQEASTQARLHMLEELRGIVHANAQLGEAAARLAMFEPRR